MLILTMAIFNYPYIKVKSLLVSNNQQGENHLANSTTTAITFLVK